MLKTFAGAGVILVSLSVVADACMEPPDITHKREMALLDDGLKASKRLATVVADAKKLQKQADTFYRSGKYAPAVEARHAALIKIGYKLEESPPGPQPRAAVPTVGAQPSKSKGAPVVAATGGCGNADNWIAPSE